MSWRRQYVTNIKIQENLSKNLFIIFVTNLFDYFFNTIRLNATRLCYTLLEKICEDLIIK